MVEQIGYFSFPLLRHPNLVLHRRMNRGEVPPGSRDTDPYYLDVRSQDGLITMSPSY